MDAKLKTNLLFAIADALGLTLLYDDKKKVLTGDVQREVMFGDLTVLVDIKVVSHLLLQDQYMVMCKVMGNLGILAVAYREHKQDKLSLYLLNQAKLDSFSGWLEKHRPTNTMDALTRLGAAVVKSFDRVGRNSWKQAAK